MLREFPIGERAGGAFVIEANGQRLRLPVRHFSSCGRHQFADQLTLDGRPASFDEALDWLARHPALLAVAGEDGTQALVARVRQSGANLATSLAGADLDRLFGEPLSFIEAESALLVGHSIHPCPKARDGFSDDDALAFAPEFGNDFPLHWYLVDRGHLFVSAPAGVDADALTAEVLGEHPWSSLVDQQHALLPCHPFQHRAWQHDPALAPLLADGRLRHLGQGERGWRATSSVRALHHGHKPWMLKFSLSVRLTNSLRHLQPEEMVRGAELCRVLASPPVQAFLDGHRQFNILAEPLGLGVCAKPGQVLPQTMVLWRDNPFRNGADAHTEVLATLLQDQPGTQLSRLALRLRRHGDPRAAAERWFRDYLHCTVGPLLTAQAEYGLLFGAHQQNIVLALDNDFPVRCHFRDCQGTGYSQLAKRLYGPHVPGFAEHSANLIDDEMGIKLMCYYLVVNASFNVISSLAAADLGSEGHYLELMADFLASLAASKPADGRVFDYLLGSDRLWAKGNFHCALGRINENTMADPLALYHPLDNPLKRHD
ncbi:IucA/IucC family protein [Gallaecimonas sp. GXIMD4217]|uniref:IucA/IucC family protein n=1 Tax=Gallaecimonas sp. GXIMD4217 TaxID=3131927 RepID=UPI00311ABF90